jgi:hypothetical protein
MSDISKLISDAYGTGTPATGASDEDQQKVAEAQFFNSLCKENGIDITKLDDGQVERLYKAAMTNFDPNVQDGGGDEPEKTAAAKAEEEQKAKEAAAAEEWAEKRAAAEKIAEVDALGRVMAHAYVNELQKIAQNGLPPALAAKAEEKKEEGDKGNGEGEKKKEEEEAKKESTARAEALIEALNKNASGESTTQNLDDVAAGWAVELLKQAEVPEDVAKQKIAAALVIGVPESTKIAMAQTPDQAAYVRALEICEKAGFEVDWDKA